MVPDILQKIVEQKWREIAVRRARVTESSLAEAALRSAPARGFVARLAAVADRHELAVIAEVKKASPSKGVIRADFRPADIAISYARGGATCVSVLTDEQFFQGADQYLVEARAVTTLPVLRKDFTVDAYQLYEARVLGADCVLLIVSVLDRPRLTALHQLAGELGLDVLIEVHDERELELAMTVEPTLVGINNRNLHTFATDLATTWRLASQVPQRCRIVTESGIHTVADVQAMLDHGVYCFLVGEAFMRAEDPGSQLQALFGLSTVD
jgi:indole-3-glycerol phosphate synthase